LALQAETQVYVVFDGAEESARFGPPAVAQRLMRVTFVPDGVEPHLIILELIDHLDSAQAVMVATDDRQLQQGVRRRGGNVISIAQLLAVLGRISGSSAGSGPFGRARRRRNQGLRGRTV
jgi:hypothetical protein